jgi:hypothetical protein
MKAVITQSGKTMAEPKAKSKKMSQLIQSKRKRKLRLRFRQNRGLKRKKKTFVKLHPRTSVIHTCYHSPVEQRSLWKMKNSAASWK